VPYNHMGASVDRNSMQGSYVLSRVPKVMWP
jgi:hypothetical protein